MHGRGRELQPTSLRIIQAAVMIDRTGEFFPGAKHDEIHERIYFSHGGIKPKTIAGFVTSEGYFVDRRTAAILALECGQVKKIINPKLGLTSSEL